MALGVPSPPLVPSGPVPPPPNALVFEFDTPGPGTYQINVAMGDALVAVTNQQIQVYDGTTFLATLFSGASAPADNYIDAQGNVLSAANWSVLNASRTFIFQTNQVVFVIGDGVHHAFIAALQVRQATGAQTQIVAPRKRFRWLRKRLMRRLFSRQRYPFGALPPQFALVKPKPKLRVHSKRFLRVKRLRKTYPFPVRIVPIVVRPTKHRPWRRRPPLHTKRRQFLPRIIQPPPPLFVPYHPLRHPRLRRTKHFRLRQRYPTLPVISVSSGSANPTARIVVVVN